MRVIQARAQLAGSSPCRCWPHHRRLQPVHHAGSRSDQPKRVVLVKAQGANSDTADQVDAEWAKEVWQEVIKSPDLGKRGEAWFAAQLVVLLLVAFPPGNLRPLIDAAGWLTVVGGLGLVVAGQQVLRKNLTPLPKPRESSTLVTNGIYEYCRHPMYGGLVLASLGLSVALGDELRMALAVLLFFVLDRKASVEEGMLQAKFADYEQYKERTKKLIPYIY